MNKLPRLSLILLHLWTAFSVYLGMAIAVRVTSDGIRELGPIFASRLVGGPLLYIFGIRRLDMATLCALVLVGGAFFCVDRALRDYLFVSPTHDPSFAPDRHRTFVRVVGWSVIILDATFFYVGLANLNSWYASGKFGPLVLTGLYVCLLNVMAYISILLWLKVEREKL